MFANKTIAQRLSIAFLLTALMVAIGGIFGVIMITRLSHDADVIFEEKYPVAREAQSLSTAIHAELLAIHSLLFTGSGALKEIEIWHNQFDQHLTVLEKMIDAEDVAAIDDIRSAHQDMAVLTDELINLQNQSTTNTHVQELLAHEEEDLERIMADISSVVDHAEEQMNAAVDDAHHLQNESIILLTALTVIAFAVAFWLGKKIARSITLPLNALVDYSSHIASGNLNEKISCEEAQDETGTLARAFRTMTNSLRDITTAAEEIAQGNLAVEVAPRSAEDTLGLALQKMLDSLRNITSAAEKIAQGDLTVEVAPRSTEDTLGLALQKMIASLRRQTQEIIDGATTIAASVAELSASSSQLASSAAENSTSISETTTTVEEVRQTAELANTKAEQMAEEAHHIRETSQLGRNATEETVESMNKIQSQMGTIAETIISLSEQSQAIGQIIATVDSLSEQSNVLAVNASIEAAKAGEQGRGFSVVAQEVKSLAEQSKQATTQVRSILNEIQKATSTAVMATEQGNKVVEKGTDTAVQAGHSIVNLTNNMEQSSDAAIQIASASQQQRIGMDQITSAMESVREASQQNAASARQLEGAVQSLKALGEKLNGIVSNYRI